ncbi:MAG: hypothetical protein ACHREM_22875, partial [Polyangiales bacterium]
MPQVGRVPRGTVAVSAGAASAVVRGHPWVFREQALRGLDDVAMGAEVIVADPSGKPIARGICDPSGPLAIRVWSHDARAPVDDALVAARIE